MNIMTKRGQMDNIVTYQHICDTNTDMPNIPSDQITLGSVCIVLQGESDGLQVYIANSQKQWQPITTGISGGGSGGGSGLQLYICNSNEYNSQTNVPTVAVPNSSTIYLVPTNNENDLYAEWIYVNNAWEQFGQATLDLSGFALKNELPTNVSDLQNDAGYLTQHQDISGKADKIDTVLDTTLSRGRLKNSTVGNGSFAFGTDVTASGGFSHAEGNHTIASYFYSHAEGDWTTASGTASHAEGQHTTASGSCTHSEGEYTTASGLYSHSEGAMTVAQGASSHAEGRNTTASGLTSHAEGTSTIASGQSSHTEGEYTIAAGNIQHVSGKYNIQDLNNKYAEIVGIGTYDNRRANGYTLDWNGNGWYAGKVTVENTTPTENGDLTSKAYVDAAIDNIELASSEDAEAWASGTRSGSAVLSTDPTYHNNAKYYAEQASNTPAPLLAKNIMRVGCIGDSYINGSYAADGTQIAWPYFMEKMTGHTWMNFGCSGSGAKTWIEGPSDLTRLSEVQYEEKKCQAYIIGLGLNDCKPGLTTYAPVGTASDIGTTENSYYAYYYRLVQAVHAVNDRAPIFCLTCPYPDQIHVPYNAAVRTIVEYCRNAQQPVFLCDLAGDAYNNSRYFKSPIFTLDLQSGHYSTLGQEMMAECLLRVISDVMMANISAFRDIMSVPFSFDTVGGFNVLANGAKFGGKDGTIDDVIEDSSYCIVGWFDSGTTESKSYTLFSPDSTGGIIRFFNDKTASSVDFWSFSGNDTRTVTAPGRYIAFHVKKSLAGNYYVYDNTNNKWIAKGKLVT